MLFNPLGSSDGPSRRLVASSQAIQPLGTARLTPGAGESATLLGATACAGDAGCGAAGAGAGVEAVAGDEAGAAPGVCAEASDASMANPMTPATAILFIAAPSQRTPWKVLAKQRARAISPIARRVLGPDFPGRTLTRCRRIRSKPAFPAETGP